MQREIDAYRAVGKMNAAVIGAIEHAGIEERIDQTGMRQARRRPSKAVLDTRPNPHALASLTRSNKSASNRSLKSR